MQLPREMVQWTRASFLRAKHARILLETGPKKLFFTQIYHQLKVARWLWNIHIIVHALSISRREPKTKRHFPTFQPKNSRCEWMVFFEKKKMQQNKYITL